MIRLIINFIIFGLIYFAIYYYFPDAFHRLVGWAQETFTFIKDWIIIIVDKIRAWYSTIPGPKPSTGDEPAKTMLFIGYYFTHYFKS